MKSIISLTSYLLIFFFTHAAKAADSQALSSSDLSYEIAYTQALLADEYFIQGQTDKAIPHYKKAQQEINMLLTLPALQNLPRIQLLADDINYRLMLAENKMPFWGGAISRKPINPVLAYIEFQDSSNEFINLVDKINRQLRNLEQQDQVVLQLSLDDINSQKDSSVSHYEGLKANVTLNSSNEQRKVVADRLEQIKTRRAQMSSEQQSLVKQLESTADNINKIVSDAVSSAVGLPPLEQMKTAVDNGDLLSAVGQTAVTMLGDPNSELSAIVAESSKDALQVLDYYQQAKQTYQEGEQLVNDLERVAALAKSSNIENLLQAGAIVYGHLDEQTQQTLKSYIEPPKELKQIIALARQKGELRKELSNFLAEEGLLLENELTSMLSSVIDYSLNDFSQLLSSALLDTVQQELPTEQLASIVNTVALYWNRVIAFEILSDEAITSLTEAINISCQDMLVCRQNLAERLLSNQLSTLPQVKLSNQALSISQADGKVVFEQSLSELVKQVQQRQIDLTKQQASTGLDNLVAQLSNLRESFSQDIINQLPDFSFDREINKFLNKVNPDDNGQLLNKLLQDDNSAINTAYNKQATFFQIGVSSQPQTAPLLEQAPAGNTNTNIPDFNPPVVTNDPSLSATENAALQALSASGPYGMAAAAAIKVLSGLENMSDIADQADRLNKEDQKLEVEVAHLANVLRQTNIASALAELDEKIANRKRQAALFRRDRIASALVGAGQNRAAAVDTVRQWLPLIYLKSELLRMQFDLLDRSLAQWVVGSTESKQMLDFIRRDPNWQRYALDSEIGLYDWFDRSLEGQRKDLENLSAHWARLKEASTLVCRKLRCTKDSAIVGELSMTESVPLQDLISHHDWQRYLQWRSSSSNTPFSATFFIKPEHFNAVADLKNVRVVNASLGGIDDQQKILQLEGARLQHSGIGWVQVGERYHLEVLQTATDTSLLYFELSTAAQQMQASRDRWADTEKALDELEGYSLYGIWSIRLQKEVDIIKAQDLLVRFVVQHQGVNNGNLLAEMEGYQVNCLTNNNLNQQLAIKNFRMILQGPSQTPGQVMPDWSYATPDNCNISSDDQ